MVDLSQVLQHELHDQPGDRQQHGGHYRGRLAVHPVEIVGEAETISCRCNRVWIRESAMARLSLGTDCNCGDCHMAKSHTVDIHVGARLRQRRSLLGMSQTKVGEAVGLTFQQIQKYERAANRVSASKLWELAQALHTGVTYFYDGLTEIEAGGALPRASMQDFLLTPDGLELAACFPRIASPRLRRKVLELVRALIEAPDAVGAIEA
jgi:transcriptional regulator with XRE-family HTH domain